MKIDRVERRFVELLQAAGGDAEALAPRPAWEAFKAFAGETIDGLDPAGDVDRLLCEAGPTRYGPAGRPAIQVDIERQYTLEADGEYEGMKHLLCSFTYPLAEQFAGTRGVQLWGSPGPASEDWATEVEATAYFALLADLPEQAAFIAGDV
jgi:hypothetical protein